MNKVITYAKSIVVPLLIGGLVGVITSKYIDYTSLSQPSRAPPSFLFPIVWTILYILMGISYGILKSKELIDRLAVISIRPILEKEDCNKIVDFLNEIKFGSDNNAI